MAEIFFGITDTGKVRVNNEDTFIAQRATNGNLIIACAIDGVGGYSGGEIAAALAKESILEHFSKNTRNIPQMMREALFIANERIYAERLRVSQHENMACVLTLAIVDVEKNEFHYIHVGDTRLYLLRDNSLVKLTKDQSFVGFLEDSGRLSEDAAMKHPKRNEINKALGFGGDLGKDSNYLETGHSPFLPGDMILLCSDGLTDMVNKHDITEILSNDSSLEDKGKKLISVANQNGGKDNITAVLVKNDKPSIKQDATKPVSGQKKASDEPKAIKTQPVIVESPPAIVADEDPVPRRRSSRTTVILLSMLSALLLGSTLYLLYELGDRRNVTAAPVTDSLHAPRISQSQVRFQQALNNLQGDTLVLSDSVFKEPIILSRAMDISQDTLYLLARGNIVFRRDSVHAGPAMMVTSASNQLILDGITFENFEIGISAQSKGIFLLGVQFKNCKIPIQYSFLQLGEDFMNGSLSELFLLTDNKRDTLQR